MRPQSNDPTHRETRSSPESSRTRTSQNCAPYDPIEYFSVSIGIGADASASIRSRPARVRMAANDSPIVRSSVRYSPPSRAQLRVLDRGIRQDAVAAYRQIDQRPVQLVGGGVYGGRDADRLARATGYRRIRQRRVAVVKRDLVDR